MTNVDPSLDLRTIRIKPLASKDAIKKLRCGESEIDSWAQSKAHKFHEQRRARVFIAHRGESDFASAFYSLALSQQNANKLTDLDDRQRFSDGPHFVFITYLAVGQALQGQGLGTFMLIDALKKTREISNYLPVYGVALRSLNDKTTAFYIKHGFAIAPNEGRNPLMILPIWTVIDLFENANAQEPIE